LWRSLSRDNVLIKIPGTEEGIPVVRQLIAEGINVNVTLLSSLDRYRAAREAWLDGLEDRRKAGLDLKVNSVASFFLSRIDTFVDPMLAELGAEAKKHLGQVAIAAAKLAYVDYLRAADEPRFSSLVDAGAQPQRLLWASTGTKNPAYSDCHYVDPLVGRATVTTLPMQTLIAYLHHGKPSCSLEEGLENACSLISMLPAYGIDLGAVAIQLEQEGLQKFIEPHDKLFESLAHKRAQILGKVTGERSIDF
jgi:transaldolase